MNQAQYRKYVAMARIASSSSADYCVGYRMGLMQHQFRKNGPKLGDPEDLAAHGHAGMAERARGYRDGKAGKPPRFFAEPQ